MCPNSGVPYDGGGRLLRPPASVGGEAAGLRRLAEPRALDTPAAAQLHAARRHRARAGAGAKPSKSASEPFARNSPIRRPDGAWRGPNSRQAAGSVPNSSRSDSAPPSDAPHRRTLTDTPSAEFPKRHSRSAVRAKAEQPPKPARRASVNLCSTLSGRGSTLFIGAPAGWLSCHRHFAGETLARCAFQSTSTIS